MIFELSGAPTATGEIPTLNWYNQLLFNTSNLNVGEHTVVVTFNGSSAGPSLGISYFYVTSLTASEQESIQHSHPSPSHTVVEAVLGVVIPVLLLAAMILLWHKRKMQGKRVLELATSSSFNHYGSDSITTPLTNVIIPTGILGEKALTLSTAPVVNPGEVDFGFDFDTFK